MIARLASCQARAPLPRVLTQHSHHDIRPFETTSFTMRPSAEFHRAHEFLAVMMGDRHRCTTGSRTVHHLIKTEAVYLVEDHGEQLVMPSHTEQNHCS